MGKRSKQSPGYLHKGFDNDRLFKPSYGHVRGPDWFPARTVGAVTRLGRSNAILETPPTRKSTMEPSLRATRSLEMPVVHSTVPNFVPAGQSLSLAWRQNSLVSAVSMCLVEWR
jgi:hypothetical protein